MGTNFRSKSTLFQNHIFGRTGSEKKTFFEVHFIILLRICKQKALSNVLG